MMRLRPMDVLRHKHTRTVKTHSVGNVYAEAEVLALIINWDATIGAYRAERWYESENPKVDQNKRLVVIGPEWQVNWERVA